MFGFLAFVWLVSRDAQREDEDGVFWLTLFLIPVVVTVCFAYLLHVGLKDLGVGGLVRWTATLLAIGLALAACLDGRWVAAVAYTFGVGLVGLVLVTVASYRKQKQESRENPDIDGPRWQFS